MSISCKHRQHLADIGGNHRLRLSLGCIKVFAEPNYGFLAGTIDFTHHCNLVRLLVFIFLIDADSINPQCTRALSIPQAPQNDPQVLRYSQRTAVEYDGSLNIRISPHIGKSLIFRLFVKRHGLNATMDIVSPRSRLQGDKSDLALL